METKEITLAGGASQQVVFKTFSDKVGKQIIEVNGLLGGFTAKGEAASPIPTTTVKPETTTNIQVPATTTASTDAPKTFGTNWIRILEIAGGVIIAGLLIIFLIRRIIQLRRGM